MLEREWPLHANHKAFVTTGQSNQLVQGQQGKRIIVHEVQLFNTTLQDVMFVNGIGGQVLEPGFPAFPAGAGFTRQYNNEPAWVLDSGAGLYLISSVAGIVRGFVKYRQIDAWEGKLY